MATQIRRSSIPRLSDPAVKIIEPQTLKAWEPFGWCVNALYELQNSDIDDEHPEWIRNWIFGVTMLRTTGHVLGKIDAGRSTLHRSLIDSRWADWKNRRDHHWVFHEFIEKERNSILKAFELGVDLDQVGIWHDQLQMDGIQLLRKAVYWWRDELELVESQLIPQSSNYHSIV